MASTEACGFFPVGGTHGCFLQYVLYLSNDMPLEVIMLVKKVHIALKYKLYYTSFLWQYNEAKSDMLFISK